MTTTWRYNAVSTNGAGQGARRRGEMNGTSAAEIRASLRRIGWQVLDLKPVRSRTAGDKDAFGAVWFGHLRSRRREIRAEIFDSAATMLESGVPVLQAVTILITADTARRSSRRTMLTQLRGALQDGSSLAQAMADHPAWFEPTEVAMVEAGQQSGELPTVLRSLAERNERANELGQRLIAALSYPAILCIVGLGVVVFLSTRTLPGLVEILTDAGVEAPALSIRVMAFGQMLANWWPLLGIAGILAVGAILVGPTWLERRGIALPRWCSRLRPQVSRRMALSGLSLGVAELIETGIPVGDAFRIVAPTLSCRSLRRHVIEVAARIDRGTDLADALDIGEWFDAEFRQLVEVGQASGELAVVLRRLGDRYSRAARRLIDRLTALLEPAVILTLAFLVGVVVMSAILPLLRLQEIL